MSRPFIKWAGGKRQLVDELLKRRPGKYGRFLEPFIGGGALFFALKPEEAFISDINGELIGLYTVVRDEVEALVEELQKHDTRFRQGDGQEYFYRVRNVDREAEYAGWNPVRKAARFIFLNKTCFNGLYRVNSRGQFNAPFGFYRKPAIVDAKNLRSCSKVLAATEIRHADFREVVNVAREGDFVYFDPPYVPLTSTANFTSYTGEGFDLDRQRKLQGVCDELDKKGVWWMLSNSHTKFVLDLYKHYNVHKVEATRAINCRGEGRGRIKEVILTNYPVQSEQTSFQRFRLEEDFPQPGHF